METITKKQTIKKEVKRPEAEIKKSKFRLFWEDRERRGVPPGVIHNIRAVLK